MANEIDNAQGGIPETGVDTDTISLFMDGLASLNTAGTDQDRSDAIATLEQFKASAPNMPLHDFIDQIIVTTEPEPVEEEAPVPDTDFLTALQENEANRQL